MSKILYEQKDGIVSIILNNPKALNAINTEMWNELRESLARFRDDPEMRVAIITGAGDRAFSCGNDISELAAKDAKPHEIDFSASMLPSLDPERGLTVWKPIIAAVNGYCFGSGFFIALSCDIRISSDNATFATPEVKLGLMPNMGVTQWLPRVVPLGVALELLLSGRTLSAHDAFHFGFVNRVVPQGELLQAAEALAREICDNGPVAVNRAKEAVYRGLGMPLTEGLNLENRLAHLTMQSEDAKERLRAFIERKKKNT